jgi:16S rRNA (guanine527-N7)-methyltransferase
VADRFAGLVRARAEHAGVEVGDDLRDALAAYLALLARWNRKINLTSFDLEVPTDAAIDRLVIEALVAAPLVRTTDRVAIDVGSGGGSPALPLRLACPQLEMVLVEVRERKAAFLREAVRELGLSNVRVEVSTFEQLAASSKRGARADLVTMRAVRADEEIWEGISAVLAPAGRILWFIDIGEMTKYDRWFKLAEERKPVMVLDRIS